MDLAGLPVGLLDPPGQPDRVMAVAGLGDQLHPAVIVRTGPSDGLSHHLRQDLTDVNRLGHVGPPCVWRAMDVGMVAVENWQRGKEVTGRCLSGSPTGPGGWSCSPRR